MTKELFLTRAQVREIDRRAIDEFGIPGVVLMENAALSVVREIETIFASPSNTRDVVVFCGGGNNGGDGYAIARHLHNLGYTQTIFAAVAPERLNGDAAINARICQNMRLDIRPLETREQLLDCEERCAKSILLIDALLGTGFSGDVRPHMAGAIRCINAQRDDNHKFVVAVDLPSGLDCDTGTPANPTVQADVTVTFVARKTGFRNPAAKAATGRIVVGSICVPDELIFRVASSPDLPMKNAF